MKKKIILLILTIVVFSCTSNENNTAFPHLKFPGKTSAAMQDLFNAAIHFFIKACFVCGWLNKKVPLRLTPETPLTLLVKSSTVIYSNKWRIKAKTWTIFYIKQSLSQAKQVVQAVHCEALFCSCTQQARSPSY